MLFRRSLTILALVLFAVAPLAGRPARAATASDASNFIATLATKTLATLKEQQLSPQQREERFRMLFHDNFDIPSISRFVLGRYWRSSSDADKQEFMKLFEDYVVRSYSARFAEYAGETVKVTSARPSGDNTSVVMSDIVHPDGSPPLKLEWTVIHNGNDYRITDVSVEGVSMVLTQRQEFASVIQHGGGQLSALNQALRQKISASAQ
jgi:phospholipid transport system substrate-binding protein